MMENDGHSNDGHKQRRPQKNDGLGNDGLSKFNRCGMSYQCSKLAHQKYKVSLRDVLQLMFSYLLIYLYLRFIADITFI